MTIEIVDLPIENVGLPEGINPNFPACSHVFVPGNGEVRAAVLGSDGWEGLCTALVFKEEETWDFMGCNYMKTWWILDILDLTEILWGYKWETNMR